jgi:hypothetical protein
LRNIKANIINAMVEIAAGQKARARTPAPTAFTMKWDWRGNRSGSKY